MTKTTSFEPSDEDRERTGLSVNDYCLAWCRDWKHWLLSWKGDVRKLLAVTGVTNESLYKLFSKYKGL